MEVIYRGKFSVHLSVSPIWQCQCQLNKRCCPLVLLVVKEHGKELGILEEGCWQCMILAALQKGMRMKNCGTQIFNKPSFWSSAAYRRTSLLFRGRVSHYAVTVLTLKHYVWIFLHDVIIWDEKDKLVIFSIPEPILALIFAKIMQNMFFWISAIYYLYFHLWTKSYKVHSFLLSILHLTSDVNSLPQ